MRRWLIWLPLAVFAGLALLIANELRAPSDRTVRSTLIDRPLPDVTLPPLLPGKPGLDRADFAGGGPRLLNIFASWCVPCIAEAPQLARLKAAGVGIDAVAVRDTGPAVATFLARYGDPYVGIGSDPASRTQLALGSSGVPETFVVDGRGVIRLQHIGAIRDEDVPELLQALAEAK